MVLAGKLVPEDKTCKLIPIADISVDLKTMKEIKYSSYNIANFYALTSLILGFVLSIYVDKSFLFAIMMSLFGFLLARFFIITKCYKFSYDENEVILINVFLPFIEYRYQFSDIKKIYEVGVMNWGSGINIINHSGRLRTFGTDGSSDKEVAEMIEFISAQLKEKK